MVTARDLEHVEGGDHHPLVGHHAVETTPGMRLFVVGQVARNPSPVASAASR
ncbi:hypothetical protein [Thermostaphylospora chromogena]|uniref:hypothetical protein n=1 Tax=Thermostaphylospora chromogena TaxID=35622 RepID=UPI0013F5A831|nr:hypothetical protein [Thermostaphylospora chromogena]